MREPQQEFEMVERPDGHAAQDGTDFLTGMRNWFQDNVGFGFGDGSETFGREDEIDEVHLL